ncbi:MAG: oxidoreductase [Chitinophagales bacterium]
MNKRAIIAGASGAVGKALLRYLLESASFDEIVVLLRRPLKLNHPKLHSIIFDFDKEADYSSLPSAEQVFCCLGTTIKKAGSQENFRKVDFHYPFLLAKYAKQNGAKAFHVVSALGADAKSSIFYNRVKGELEEALRKVEFDNLYIYQPSLLLSEREESRPGEKIASVLMQASSFLFLGPLKKYKAIHVNDVAKAMLCVAQSNSIKSKTIASDEIQTLADNFIV